MYVIPEFALQHHKTKGTREVRWDLCLEPWSAVQVPSTSATSGEAAHTGTDSEDEVEASFKAAADRLRLQRQEEQMLIEDRLNM